MVAELTELLAEAASTPSNGPPCWVANLTGDAKAFMDALEKRFDAGEAVVFEQASRILRREWGVTKDGQQVKRHLRRVCRCRP